MQHHFHVVAVWVDLGFGRAAVTPHLDRGHVGQRVVAGRPRTAQHQVWRVVRQPHLSGGLLLMFADITDELKLKAEFNALILVQQATLDKLTDAVAVFGSDGRLKLHNEAFERFWNVTGAQLDAAPDFEGVVELCLPRLHDRQFWRELKARVRRLRPRLFSLSRWARVRAAGRAPAADGGRRAPQLAGHLQAPAR